jgi:hypothetical protein
MNCRSEDRGATSEFVNGFKGLFSVGSVVTWLGSARFKEKHAYYRLARDTGSTSPLPHEQIANPFVDRSIEFHHFPVKYS